RCDIDKAFSSHSQNLDMSISEVVKDLNNRTQVNCGNNNNVDNYNCYKSFSLISINIKDRNCVNGSNETYVKNA
ncbi:unnamed protein product, partial [Adineta steineri]